MNFSDTFEMPITRTVDGTEFTIPRLTTRDYLKWGAEETEAMREEARSLIPTDIKPMDLLAARKQAARVECTLDELARQILFRPSAQLRVLEMSAAKAGISDIAGFIDSANPRRNQIDACRVSGLFPASELAERFPEEIPSWVLQMADAGAKGDDAKVAELMQAIRKPNDSVTADRQEQNPNG